MNIYQAGEMDQLKKMLAAQGLGSELGAQNTRITQHGGPSFNLNTRGMGRGR